MEKKVLIPEEYFGTKIKISDFTHIRAYHACRIEDKESYIKQGILPIEEESARNKAITLFAKFGYRTPDIQSHFNDVWKSYFSPSTPPHVYLVLDPNDFKKKYPQYLIFGSELLSAVANDLGRDACRDKLRTIGKPTILKCDVKIDQILKDSLTHVEDAIFAGNIENIDVPVDKILPQDIIDFMSPHGQYQNPYNLSNIVCF